jgi:hypothetical protein
MVVSEEVHFTLTGPVEPSEKWPVAVNGCVSPAETLDDVGATVIDCSTGTTAVLVSEKFTVVRPAAAAVTTYGPPAAPFAVNGAAATPAAFVGTTIVAVLLLNNPDAPDPGAVNVTFTPATGLLPASFTVTANAVGNGVLTAVDCGVVPAFAVIVVGVPELTLMAFEVPVIVALTVSVAVTVLLPAVFKVTGNTPVPFVSVEFAGSTAAPSVLVKCTVPVYPAAMLLN